MGFEDWNLEFLCNMFLFFRSKTKEEVNTTSPGYEEQEQKTPKAGYILLFFMFVTALFFGWRALDDLRDVPSRPELLSHCAQEFLTTKWEDIGRYQYLNYPVYELAYPTKESRLVDFKPQAEPPCIYSVYETRYDIPVRMERHRSYNRELQDVEIKLGRMDTDIAELDRAYDMALQEKMANVGGRIYSITELYQKKEDAKLQRSEFETRRDELRNNLLKDVDENLRMKYRELMLEYRVAWRWYEFKLFLLEMIFVFPFFWFVFRMYKRLLAKNSPYTIIFTALVAVASVLTLRILIIWFWSLFLARIIQTLWNFIQNFALLKSLVFFGGMFLVITIFGGSVYWLQKRIFEPKRVALRRMRQKQCPNCQTSLDLAESFCPNCGRKLKEKCSICNNERWLDFSTCGYCGSKK